MNKIIVILFALVFLISGKAVAQDITDQVRIDEKRRLDLLNTETKILEGEKRLIFDFGGWHNIRFDNYNNDDNDASLKDTYDATTAFDTRFWMKATLQPEMNSDKQNTHSAYLRLRNIYTITAPEDTNVPYDNAGPHLDQGYIVLDFRPWWIEAGRRYFSMGQGIAYSNVNDGISISLVLTDWSLIGIAAHTLPHEDNIDLSIPGGSKTSDRTYYGVEARYMGISGQSIYGYFVAQRDHSDEDPIDLNGNYTYNSEYTGFGLQGKLIPQIHYWVEIIRETGESFIYTTNEQKNVDAWAMDVGLSCDFDIYSRPNFSFAYAFGSGDSDRISVTDTQSGNISGDDTNFLYFGYLPTGYALSPRVSNLHFYKISTLFKPLEKFQRFKNFSIGIDFYQFYKDKKTGGISDLGATVNEKDIGREIDVNISWQISSDVTLAWQYGHFMPGDAYSDSTNDNENYFSLDMTIMF